LWGKAKSMKQSQQNPKSDKEKPESWRFFTGAGLQFAGTVAVCAWIGSKTDDWLNSSPFGVLFGIFFGIFAAMVNLIKAVQSVGKK
jgi:F0F1-type ATP synthase assembly protein I